MLGLQSAEDGCTDLQDQQLTTSYRQETATKLKQVEELEDPDHPRVFHVTQCSACGGQLDLPSVHFMCNHSYHQRYAPPFKLPKLSLSAYLVWSDDVAGALQTRRRSARIARMPIVSFARYGGTMSDWQTSTTCFCRMSGRAALVPWRPGSAGACSMLRGWTTSQHSRTLLLSFRTL